MKRNTMIIIFVLIQILLGVNCQKSYHFKNGKITDVNTIAKLDKIALFGFAIMSDNKGDSPLNSKECENMVKWIKKSGNRFVIGLGDHVKKGWENSFLVFLKENRWWQDNFYPNIADGENEFYGKSQSDWGAGAPFFNEVNLSKRLNIDIRDNKCEYYAKIQIDDYTIHLIQLHYPDQPKEDSIAFPEDSKRYLIEVLGKIKKSKKDIIIACAHSRKGFWIDQLSDEQKDMVMNKCDLLLSATTHFFERKIVSGYEDNGPLVINTGSITYPNLYCPYGYIQVHVLENPFSLIVQYINTKRPEIEMQHSEYAFMKIIGGKTMMTDFRDVRIEEDMDRVVGSLPKEYSKDDLSEIIKSLYINVTNANEAYIKAGKGLKKGNTTYRELWDVFPYNNEIYSIDLTSDEVKRIFKDKIPLKGLKEIKLAVNNYYGDYIIKELGIPEERFSKTGIKEIPLLIEWIEKQ
ncbi:hypothetical protein KAU43_03295 [candidate division WOR-3 bacterium]|nr:hypothetical protein [candidate division WOR-3 bacterium]